MIFHEIRCTPGGLAAEASDAATQAAHGHSCFVQCADILVPSFRYFPVHITEDTFHHLHGSCRQLPRREDHLRHAQTGS